MLEALIAGAWIGLSSASATVIVRRAPFVDKLVERGVKPFACDVCMTLWCTLAAAACAHFAGEAGLWGWAPGYAIGKYVLRLLTDPEGVPSSLSLPPLEDLDDAPIPGEDTKRSGLPPLKNFNP